MESLRILYLTPSVKLMGARISLFSLVESIRNLGVDPIVICPSEGDLTSRLQLSDINYKVIKLGCWRKFKNFPLHPISIYRLIQFVRVNKIQLIHSNEFWVNPFATWVSKYTNIPCICHFRCSRTRQQLPPWKLKKYGVHKVKSVIAVSQHQLQLLDFLKDYNVPVSVIPNGVDVNRFNPAGDKTFWKQSLGLDPQIPAVGLVGMIAEHKGQLDFIKALHRLNQKNIPLNGLIVGIAREPRFLEHCKKLVREYKLHTVVRFLDYQDDIEKIYKALDLHVTPSHQEAFGRVNIEAMACEVPVIAYKVGGIPEIITDQYDGFLVDPNPEALALQLEQVLTNKQMLNQLGKNARLSVCQKFSLEMHVKKIKAEYDSILNRTS